jgi:hypothetical protein
MLVNEPHELRCAGLSSSAAKKADAALRISLVISGLALTV